MTGIATAASVSLATAEFRTKTEKASTLTTVAQRHRRYVTPRNRYESGSSLQSDPSGSYLRSPNVLAFGSPEWWRQTANDHGCGQR
jgi:hypothetical protein